MKPLGRAFYERDTRVVAFELIGKALMFEQNGLLLSGRVVETEAYFGARDPASHAYRGPTLRNRPMFGPGGISYVYFTYGNHFCLNVVTERDQVPGAVLIRAVEPIAGISVMQKRRKLEEITELASGPGKLTQAFGIGREHSGLDLTRPPFYLSEDHEAEYPTIPIRVAKRVGISQAKDRLLRFYWIGNLCVSKR